MHPKIHGEHSFNRSAVNATSPPPWSLFNLRIAVITSLMIQNGSEDATAGIGTSHGPLKSVTNMQAKSFSWGERHQCGQHFGAKNVVCMALHPPGVARKRDFGFPLTHFFGERFGFANSVVFASVAGDGSQKKSSELAELTRFKVNNQRMQCW